MKWDRLKPRGWVFLSLCLCITSISRTSVANGLSGQQAVKGEGANQRISSANADVAPNKEVSPVATTIENLRRDTAVLSSKVRHLGAKVNNLESWKIASVGRIERLENMVLAMRAERAGHSDHRELEMAFLGMTSRNEDNPFRDLIIGNANVEFERHPGKVKRGVDSIPMTPRDDSASTVEESAVERLSNAVIKLNKTVQHQGKFTYQLFARLGRTQKYMARRFSSMELKTKKAQKTAERASKSVRTHTDTLDTLNEELQSQKGSLSALQNEVSKGNSEREEMLRRGLEAMNANTSAKIHGLEEEIGRTSAAASSLSFLLTEQMNLSASTALELAKLQKSHGQEKILVARSVSRINRRLTWRDRQTSRSRATLRKLTVDIARQKQITEDIKKTMTSNPEAIELKLGLFAENITELQTNSLSASRRLQSLYSIVEISQIKQNATEIALADLTSRLDNSLDQIKQSLEEDLDETSAKLGGALAALNGSFEGLSKEQAELSAMKERVALTEKWMRVEVLNLANITNATGLQLSRLQLQILDNHNFASDLDQLVRSNLSSRVEKLENVELRNKDNVEEIREEVLDLSSTMRKSFSSLENVDENFTSIWKKFGALRERIQENEENLERNDHEINVTKLLFTAVKADLDRVTIDAETTKSSVHQMEESHAADNDRYSIRLDTIQQKIESQMSDLREITGLKFVEIAERVSGLERANVSLHMAVDNWIDELNAIEGGIESLREADTAVSTALSAYQSAITKHDHVQRNLTKISEKVRGTLQGHGLALKSIQDIMQNLNQSLNDAEVESGRSCAEDISSQNEEIQAMRLLMTNFSSVLSEVLNDQLSHDVLHATIGATQRSIIQRLDSSSAQIDDLRREAQQNAEKIETVEVSQTRNTNYFRTTKSDLENYTRVQARLEDKREIFEAMILELNRTQVSSRREMESWSSKFRGELTRIATKQRETIRHQAETTEAINAFSLQIGRVNTTASFFAEEVDRVKDQQKVLSANLTKLSEQIETSKELLRELDTRVVDETQSLVESINQIQDSCQNIGNVSDERIAQISQQIERLLQNSSMTQSKIHLTIENMKQIEQRSRETEEALAKIRTTEIHRINHAMTKSSKRLDAVETDVEIYASILQSLVTNNSNILDSVHGMADNLLDQEARMSDLLKLRSEEDRATKKETKKLRQILENYQTNVSEIEVQMHHLLRSIDYNYNSTQLIFDLLDGQEERMTLLHDESSALIPSLAASIGNFDYSLQNINASLRYHVGDLKDLLRDFQAAFDTSNRDIARYVDELNIVKTNSSNQFAQLSESTDYLKQIAHEMSKAIDENRDRVDAINETVLTLKLFTPILDGISEGEFASSFSEKRGMLDSHSVLNDRGVGKVLEGEPGEKQERSPVTNRFEQDGGDIVNGDYFENFQEQQSGVFRDVQRIDRRVSRMANVMEWLQSSIYQIGNQSESIKTLMEKPSLTGTVAFSAGLTSDFVCCGVVIFDNVYINDGNGYDDSTGKFAAPENGVYAFFVSVAERNSFVRGALVQNGMSLITVQLDHSAGHYEQSQSSNFVILYLQAGTQVWLQIFTGTLQSYQFPTVTFSGFLVSRLN